MQCFLNETGIYLNNKLDESILNEYLDNNVNDDAAEMKPVILDAFKTCAAKIEEFKSKMDEKNKDNPRPTPSDKMRRQHCNPGAGFLMGCAMIESFKNCAPSNWNDNQQCNDKRDFLMNCMPKGFRGHHGRKGKHGSDNSVDNKSDM